MCRWQFITDLMATRELHINFCILQIDLCWRAEESPCGLCVSGKAWGLMNWNKKWQGMQATGLHECPTKNVVKDIIEFSSIRAMLYWLLGSVFCWLGSFGDVENDVLSLNVYHLIEKVSNEIDFKLTFHDCYLVHLHRNLRWCSKLPHYWQPIF